jgi:hypothetical protein
MRTRAENRPSDRIGRPSRISVAEEEDEDTDLREEQEGGVTEKGHDLPSADERREEIAEDDPDEELPQHRRLAPPLGHHATGLRHQHEYRDGEEQRSEVGLALHSDGPAPAGNRQENPGDERHESQTTHGHRAQCNACRAARDR